MILFKTASNLRNYLHNQIQHGYTVGFVPTMGALHQGHISLSERSKTVSDVTVCSVFVNPTQFNDSKDFDKYPITIEQDILLLEQAGCDILFLPSVNEVYPQGKQLDSPYALGSLETMLEGAFRPNHFQGVCQVVHRLLSIVQPQYLFLGQKDYQQCMVLQKLIQLLGMNVETVIVPTLREPSGLAMSSRNMRLSDDAKQHATAIYQSLLYLQQQLDKDNIALYEQQVKEQLLQQGFEKVDYVKICDAFTLQHATSFEPNKKYVGLIAAFINEVRLIDNLLLN